MQPQGVGPSKSVAYAPSSSNSASKPAASQASSPPPISQPIDIELLFQKKLNDPNTPLSFNESIQLLDQCVKKGEIEAAKAEGKHITVLIGNTGAGKSTFGNKLCGCTFKEVTPKSLGLTGLNKLVVVKSAAEGGACNEVMPIGHTKLSKTFMPQIETSPNGMTICDCPGFLDNRGYEINVANAVNIRNAFIRAASVKVIMLINYHALLADRGRGLKDMIEIACDLFGSKENLIKYKDSIYVGISHVPLIPADMMEEQQELDELRKFIADTPLTDEFSVSTLKYLAERIFIFDPLDRPNLQYKDAWQQQAILDNLQNLPPIEFPLNIFRTVLTPSDEKGLISICNQIQQEILRVFKKADLTQEDFDEIARYQDSLKRLEVIDHIEVTKLVISTRGVITKQFREMVNKFEQHCIKAADQLSDEADILLKRIQEGIKRFDKEVQADVNLTEVETRYQLMKKRIAAKKAATDLLDLERRFRDSLQATNFKEASNQLSTIEAKISAFQQYYNQTGITLPLNLDSLKNLYTSSKEIHDNRQMEAAERDRKLEKLKDKFKEALKLQKENEARLEEEIKKNKEKELKAKQEIDKQKAEHEAALKKLRDDLAKKPSPAPSLPSQPSLPPPPAQPVYHPPHIDSGWALREQIFGSGPIQFFNHPQCGVCIRCDKGQGPTAWYNIPMQQAVVQTPLGFIFVDNQRAVRVHMTPTGPVPL